MFKKIINKKLKYLKNKYKDKSAIIFANGPSVSSINFDLIKKNKNLITLTTNQIANICIEKEWFPDLYCAFFCEPLRGEKYKINMFQKIDYPGNFENALIAQKNIQYLTNNKSTLCFLNHWYKVFMKEKENCHFIKPFLWNRFIDLPENTFEKYKLPKCFLWNIATTPLFQLCFYFELKNIAIIGQDGYFENKKSNHYKNYVGYEHSTSEKMASANKRINQLLDACKYYAIKKDINIYNLSNYSRFNQFKKVSIEEYIDIINLY